MRAMIEDEQIIEQLKEVSGYQKLRVYLVLAGLYNGYPFFSNR